MQQGDPSAPSAPCHGVPFVTSHVASLFLLSFFPHPTPSPLVSPSSSSFSLRLFRRIEGSPLFLFPFIREQKRRYQRCGHTTSCNPFLLEWVAATCTLFLLRINSGTGRWIGFDSFLRFLSYDVTSHNFETILRTLYRKDRKENFPNRFRSLSRKILSSPSSIIIISNYLCTAIIIVHRFHQIRFNDTIEGNNIF